MSIFSSTEIRKEKQRSKAEQREIERAEKRNYRDLRYAALRWPLTEDDWRVMLTLHARYGREGGREMAYRVIPDITLCQECIPGGTPIPDDLWEQWKPEAVARTSTRKVRSDAGVRRARK